MLPSISNYGRYSNNNYGVNSLRVDFGSMTVYFSYKTIVAYRDYEDGLVICENVWSNTTGKHLNWINPDHSIRKDFETFEKMLEEALERHIQ